MYTYNHPDNYNYPTMKQVVKEITINGDSLVMDIQKAFNLLYPFLKIEFSKSGMNTYLLKNIKVSPADTIKQVTGIAALKKLDVAGNKTVAEVEKELKDALGLYGKIFRKSGNVWNMISLTDSWTLESQNKAGEFISKEMVAAS